MVVLDLPRVSHKSSSAFLELDVDRFLYMTCELCEMLDPIVDLLPLDELFFFFFFFADPIPFAPSFCVDSASSTPVF